MNREVPEEMATDDFVRVFVLVCMDERFNIFSLGMKRAEWGLDSVTVGVNDTNLDGFQDDFSAMMPDMFTWFQTESAVPRITCDSKGNALEFSRNGGRHNYVGFQ